MGDSSAGLSGTETDNVALVSKKPEEDEKINLCPICNRGFDTVAGIRQHWTKGHPVDEINTIIANKTQLTSQQLTTSLTVPSIWSPSLSVGSGWNKFQIIKDDVGSPMGKSYYQFDIIENDNLGDCLFSAVLAFLRTQKDNFVTLPKNAQELRSMVVNHILWSNDVVGQSNFGRFRDNLTINLQLEILSFSSSSISDEVLKIDYATYMSSPGKYGTTAELCAMAEIFNFGFCVIRVDDYSNYTCYDYGSIEKVVDHRSNSVVHLLFSGNVGSGHFRLLSPNKESLGLIIPPGDYKLIKDHTTSRVTSIASIHLSDLNTDPIDEQTHANDTSCSVSSSVSLSHINASNTQDDNVPNRHQHVNRILNDRMLCGVCGFTAKNERGLKIHSRVHRNGLSGVSPQTSSQPSVLVFRDELDLLEKFGLLINKCKHAIPLIRIIQKSVRTIVCQELTSVIEHVVLKNDIFAWFRLWSFPFFVLNMISKGNHRQNYIRQNLNKFSRINDIQGIFRELNKLLASITHKNVTKQSEDLLIKTVHRKASEGDISGAARVLCSQEGIAEYSVETIQKLLAKHPEDSSLLEEIIVPCDSIDTSCEQVVNSIKNFPMSSSGGLDGLRPRHLKDLISFTCKDFSTKLTTAIAKLMNVIRRGKVTTKVLPIFYGATLTALVKKNKDIRPIAVGLVWRRLAGKISCFDIKVSLTNALQPIQNGFGVKGGAEAIIHAIRTLVSTHSPNPMAILKFDFKNAFNEMKREYLLQEIKNEAPELFPMLQQAYRCPSNLYYGDIVISSERGVQQGDPCGPPAFCIGLKRLSHSLSSRFNTWFLDDGTIGDEFDVILDDTKKVLEFFDISGLSLNTAKCEVFFVNTSLDEQQEMLSKLNELLPGIKLLDEPTFELLGAPVLDDGLTRVLESHLEVMKLFCSRLPKLDVHPALSIFRGSLSSQRFQYLLRTSPTFKITNILSTIDSFFRSTLEVVTNNKIDDKSWNQACLPLSFAGLGLRKLTDLSYPAYFSSMYQSAELVTNLLSNFNLSLTNEHIQSLLQDYPPEFIPEQLEKRKFQVVWDSLRVKKMFNDLLESSGPSDRARLLASSTKPSSKWLQVVPSHQLGLYLDNSTARIATGLRLGTKVCEPHICVCNELVKENGLHGLSCNKAKGTYIRHTDINKIFSMAFSSAQFPNTLEPYGLSRLDGQRPDGKTIAPWSRGKALIWDVTVVDTVAPSYLRLTSKNSGSAADEAERGKHNDYINLKADYNFIPLAFESFGSIGPETSKFLNLLGKLMSRATGEPRSLNFLLQRISVAIQRGNAINVLGTFKEQACDNVFL